jgi:hypothetical protein
MRLLIVCLLSLACPTWAAAAELISETGSEVGLTGQSSTGLYRFELSPPDLIETELPFFIGRDRDRYHVLQNNNHGLIAGLSLSDVEAEGQKATVAGIVTINKETGEMAFSPAIAGGVSVRPERNVQPLQGKCFREP